MTLGAIERRHVRPMTLGWAMALVAVLCTPVSGAAQSGSVAAMTLPATIPIFPLQDVVLFPNSTRPLHIFEPRYRAMVADALEGDSIIGMVLLQPGNEAEYEGRPPVYAVGCAGIIVAAEELSDGRYNIVLGGLVKFRVLSEDASRPYRLAEVEALPEAVEVSDRPLLAQRRQQLEDALLSVFPGMQPPPSNLSDEEVVDGLSLVLPLEPADRQELLEADGPVERALRLIRRLRGSLRAASEQLMLGGTQAVATSCLHPRPPNHCRYHVELIASFDSRKVDLRLSFTMMASPPALHALCFISGRTSSRELRQSVPSPSSTPISS